MKKHADSIDAAILARIRSGAKDYVWTPADFLDLGSRVAVDKALSRNVKSDQLRRAGRGFYHLLRQSPQRSAVRWLHRPASGGGAWWQCPRWMGRPA